MDLARAAIGSLNCVINKFKFTSWQTITKLFTSLIRSLLMYGSEVWSLKFLGETERIQTTFYKHTLQIRRNCPGYAVRLETGSIHLSYYIFKGILNYIEKIHSMSNDTDIRNFVLTNYTKLRSMIPITKTTLCSSIENFLKIVIVYTFGLIC